jgi:hypothetical protein
MDNTKIIKVISLDIDRTLVHAVEKKFVTDEFKYFEHFLYHEYTVFLRPHLNTFLSFLFHDLKTKYKKDYNIDLKIGLFTGGSREYALKIEEILFKPYQYNLDFIYCDTVNKKSSQLEERLNIKRENIIMIDDSVSIKKLNFKECYLINKFVICDDFEHKFFPLSKEDNGLLRCKEYISLLDTF